MADARTRNSHPATRERPLWSDTIGGGRSRYTYIGTAIFSDNGRFAEHYPGWKLEYDAPRILEEIHAAQTERQSAPVHASTHRIPKPCAS